MTTTTAMTLFAVSLLVSVALARHTGHHQPPHVDACQRAADQCDFKFKPFSNSFVPTFDLWKGPDVAFTTRIISKNPHEKLGILNSNNIIPEFINDNGSISLITYEGDQSFTPTHFKPYTIKHTDGSGIGHQTFQGNQKHVAKGRCIRVFFSEYQVLSNGYPSVVVGNLRANRHDWKCVVFRTK